MIVKSWEFLVPFLGMIDVQTMNSAKSRAEEA